MAERDLPRGIYKRGRIYWIRYAIAPGKMRSESTGSTQLRHAKALLATREDERFRAGKYPDLARSEKTLLEVVAHYRLHIKHADTVSQIEPRLIDALAFLGEDTPIREISFERVDAWISSLITRRSLQPQSLRLYLGALRAAFRYAKRSRLTDFNPMADYEIPKGKKKRKRVATEQEIRKILEWLLSHRKDEYRIHLRAAVEIAIETGMRRAEISELRLSWVDIENRIVRIPQAVTKADQGRSVPLTSRALAVLLRRREEPIVALTPAQITDKFGRTVDRLRIIDLHFHDLRHTRATSWIKAGVPEKVVQEILGHESVEMTRHYTNLTETDLLDAVRRLESVR